MTWTNQNFSVGQVLTAAQMNNLNDNVTALANGDSGAPPITTAALDDNVVTTSKLSGGAVETSVINTSTASSSGSDFNSGTNITLNNPAFFPMIYLESTTEWVLSGHTSEGSASQPRFRIIHTGGAERDYAIKWKYIN